MTNSQILKKAIEKTWKNGEDRGFSPKEDNEQRLFLCKTWIDNRTYYSQIFSHDFAKAFWGEKKGVDTFLFDGRQIEANFPYWKFELQHMVLEKEPLKYIEKFL